MDLEKLSHRRERISHSLPPQRFDFPPIELPSSYGQICLDLGAGCGMFSLIQSSLQPDSLFLAIERTNEKFNKLKNSHSQSGLAPNLVPIQADGLHWCIYNLPERFLDNIFILYPNPYPKQGQANKRFHNNPLFFWLLTRLKIGGQLTLATNEWHYLNEAMISWKKVWGLKVGPIQLISSQAPPRTHFERKYLLRGLPCYQAQATQTNS